MAESLDLITLQAMQAVDALRSLARAKTIYGLYCGLGGYVNVSRKLMEVAAIELEGEIASRCKGWAAVSAERERIVALIRAKAEEWEAENQRVMDYGGTPVLDGEVSAARDLITLIEATDG